MGKVIDILDLLPEEAIKQVDELGYDLLRQRGYEVEGAVDSLDKQKAIKAEMKKNGDQLLYFGMIDKDTKAILIWFEIHHNKEKVLTSRGLKFLPKNEGGQGGEGEDKERPSDTPKDNA